ncbi:hypothetical protein FGO68_gene5086 [Halteria grandinella]|uniref:Uncharacterized protein n=1 Tax=Halteria grandinella TaxID=5974 RepID=A0A8J8NZB1_HALGN|nr:hypothetical protein FGO68_gene5086 [Halteria grandinella]
MKSQQYVKRAAAQSAVSSGSKHHVSHSEYSTKVGSQDKTTEDLLQRMSFQEKMRFYNTAFTGGFSQHLSTNTLRNDSPAFSFPRGPRMNNPPEFIERSPSNIDVKKSLAPAFYDIPSTLKPNATCFGIGEKKASYIFHKGTPAPGEYQIKRIYENLEQVQKVDKKTGKDLLQCSFGLPHEAYRQALVIVNEPNTPQNQSRLVIKTPGYNNRRLPSTVAELQGRESPGPQYTFQSALKDRPRTMHRRDFPQASYLYDLESAQKNIPPPASYTPNNEFVEPSRYKGVGLGYGMRMDPLLFVSNHKMLSYSPLKNNPMYIQVPEGHLRHLPGPGQYRPQSKFDKYQGLDIVARKLIKQLSKEGHSKAQPKKIKVKHLRNTSEVIKATYDVIFPLKNTPMAQQDKPQKKKLKIKKIGSRQIKTSDFFNTQDLNGAFSGQQTPISPNMLMMNSTGFRTVTTNATMPMNDTLNNNNNGQLPIVSFLSSTLNNQSILDRQGSLSPNGDQTTTNIAVSN